MGGSMREPRQTYHHGDLRRALLIAAEEELADKGAEGFTLRGCAKRAGVSHAAPAHHFADAAGLLSALAAEGFGRFLATLVRRQEMADDQSPEGRLVAMGLGYIDFARANPALFKLMFSSQKPDFDDPQLSGAARAAFEHLASGVAARLRNDPLTTREGRLRVAAVWAVAHGLADLVTSNHMRFLASGGSESLDDDLAEILARSLSW